MAEHEEKRVYKLNVFADNFQFQLQDQVDDLDYPEYWNDALLTQLFVSGKSIIGIGTVRDLDVDVTLEIYENPMDEIEMLEEPDLSDYDHAVQCNMEILSGKLLLTGCTAEYEESYKLDLPAGSYGVRVFWSNLDCTDELGFEGDDRYLIRLYPDTHFEECVLKTWRQIAFQLNPYNN